MNFRKLLALTASTLFLAVLSSRAQETSISGKIISEGNPIEFANVVIANTHLYAVTDTAGFYKISKINTGSYIVRVLRTGFTTLEKPVVVNEGESITLNFDLSEFQNAYDEIVITGTLKEVSRAESPIPVEMYKSNFFKKNPTPSIYEALQNINGVRPQLNCQVCNTGDIKINGLDGPYTMILIDGMPIVSSLSTVYGLSGIPNSLIERVEIVKGPASSLYGSEAVGGLINIITKKPQNAPLLSTDIFGTSWGEYNVDLGLKLNLGKKISVLTGINYFNFQNKIDKNQDNFTDITLQHRVSVFQKWNIQRKHGRQFNLAGRYMTEDRWGGDLRWEKQFRGGDSIYGESIYTTRWELFGNYQLPTKEKLLLSFSYNLHDQNSVYGNTPYIARQEIAFTQLSWDKKMGNHDFLLGSAMRYTFYDDNTPGTASADSTNQINQPQRILLPGIFFQDEISISKQKKILIGARYDYNTNHGSIYTPRFAYKWTINDKNILRLNTGTGFRVVNLFTEDHAALTGARSVEIKNELRPEQSYNLNFNYIRNFYSQKGTIASLDASAFYTHFNNRIVGDFETNPNKIIYDNLSGHATSKGITLNVDLTFHSGLKINAGGTLMENTLTENGKTEQQILTENFTGTWAISYTIDKANLTIDYTGNVYSPMRLPLLSDTDPRNGMSPWWSIQNIQFTYSSNKNIQIYTGVKNLFNWTPNRNNPFLIARTHDPFDKEVTFDGNGQAIATPNNPYGLTFDPTYAYAPNQGIRIFFGLRYNLN